MFFIHVQYGVRDIILYICIDILSRTKVVLYTQKAVDILQVCKRSYKYYLASFGQFYWTTLDVLLLYILMHVCIILYKFSPQMQSLHFMQANWDCFHYNGISEVPDADISHQWVSLSFLTFKKRLIYTKIICICPLYYIFRVENVWK